MTPLGRMLRERIAATGPLTFKDFMEAALYHPEHGYYASGAIRTGRAGHFMTSAELDPIYGELWAGAFEDTWRACGEPQNFDVIEVGPGEGGFAAACLASVSEELGRALRYRLVERVPAVQARQRARLRGLGNVAWSASLGSCPRVENGLVFANELLDNLSFHLVEKSGGRLVELVVDIRGPDLALERAPLSSPALSAHLGDLGVDLPEGHRYEIGLDALGITARAAERVARGAVIFVDYGEAAPDPAPRAGATVVAHSAARVDEAVLEDPGERDISAHVNWTAILEVLKRTGFATGIERQGDVLRALGARDRDAGLADEQQRAGRDGLGADMVRALSRRHALRALLDPGGLGGLAVATGARGIDAPRWMKGPAPPG